MANHKLTDTQRVILSAAGARDGGLVLPLPTSLRVNRGTQTIVLRSLLSKGLVETRLSHRDEEVWETHEDGSRASLVITPSGLEAVGIFPESGTEAEDAAGIAARGAPVEDETDPNPVEPLGTPVASAADREPSAEPAKETKLGTLIAALRRKDGATITELSAATGWQAHSVRGAISGALKKKLGLAVVSEPVAGRDRVYRISGAQA